MTCRVRYLNSAGIHAREIPGIEGLATAYPSHWLLYASFQCLPKRSLPIEIDAMVVMDDRVLLLEIKDWNGELTANGDQWLVDGRSRGRSPVDTINMKAKKVSSFLSQIIPGFSKILVDSRVVLTGSACKDNLPIHEQKYVLDIGEARSLADSKTRSVLLSPSTIMAKRPWQYEEDFERVTRNAKLFGPLEAVWDGFRVVDEDVVVHPRRLWREHRGERVRDPRTKALIRIWEFDKLGPGLNCPEHRRFVIEREKRAIGRLEALNSKLVPSGVLMPIGDEKDEILTQHYELRRLPGGWTTLDRFLERTREYLSLEDRALTAATLLNAIGELHIHGIAHRDLGERNIWVGDATAQGLTGLMACQMPDDGSVGEWLDTLRCYGPVNAAGAGKLGAKQQDVQAAARLALKILNCSQPNDLACAVETVPASLQPWFLRALASDSVEGFRDAREAAEEFGHALDVGETGRVDQAVLDRHETATVPYVRWSMIETIHQSASKHVYRSIDPATQRPVIVKIWFGLRRGLSLTADLALMRLFDGVARIQHANRPDFPNFVSAGLSGVGAFVAYFEAQGRPWAEVKPVEASRMLGLAASLRARPEGSL